MTHTLDLNAMVAGYLACAIWSSGNAEETDELYGFDADDFSDAARKQAYALCLQFATDNATPLQAYIDHIRHPENSPSSMAGHDLWLTRNGHGTGFWDRNAGYAGSLLTDAAKKLGEMHVWVDEDSELYFEL